ncbi:MAG: HEPN domain-containing protein [Bacteroidota bacterium]|nr:HEPN domain-containing protein [Bacteroidota bacterium]
MTTYLNIPQDFEHKERLAQLLYRILNTIALNSFYLSRLQQEDNISYYFLTGFIDLNIDPIPSEVLTLVSKSQQDYPEFKIRLYTEEQAQTELERGSLYFIEHCSLGECVYANPEGENLLMYSELPLNNLIKYALRHFKREQLKVRAFESAADTFIREEHFGLAAFNFHQAFELLFRCIERLCIGKSKITHSICSHINYCKAFFPQVIPFSNSPEDKEVLILLEHAYSAGRYEDEYLIDHGQLEKIKNELTSFHTKAEGLYTKHLKYCLKRIQREISEVAEESQATTSESSMADKPNLESNEKLMKLIEEKIIKRKEATQTGYRLNIEVQGITDVLFTISGILKVCILACNYAEGRYSRIIPQPNINIQTALEHIYELLPFEEMECLEEIVKKYSEQHVTNS